MMNSGELAEQRGIESLASALRNGDLLLSLTNSYPASPSFAQNGRSLNCTHLKSDGWNLPLTWKEVYAIGSVNGRGLIRKCATTQHALPLQAIRVVNLNLEWL